MLYFVFHQCALGRFRNLTRISINWFVRVKRLPKYASLSSKQRLIHRFVNVDLINSKQSVLRNGGHFLIQIVLLHTSRPVYFLKLIINTWLKIQVRKVKCFLYDREILPKSLTNFRGISVEIRHA